MIRNYPAKTDNLPADLADLADLADPAARMTVAP